MPVRSGIKKEKVKSFPKPVQYHLKISYKNTDYV